MTPFFWADLWLGLWVETTTINTMRLYGAAFNASLTDDARRHAAVRQEQPQ